MQLDLLVKRRGLDPSAETCLHALCHLMRVPVAGVERGELWRFEVAAGESAAECRERLERAAARAGRYVNQNRDTCTWLDGPQPYPEAAPAGGSVADVWVLDGDGRDAAALEYYRSQAVPALADMRRGVLWRLWLPEPDARAARALAQAITVTRSRRAGLLMNPQAQTAEVLHVLVASPAKEGT